MTPERHHQHEHRRITNAVIARAIALVGSAVVLRLTSGADFTGTLTSVTRLTVGWPSGITGPVVSINITAADSKLHNVRPDAIVAIG